MIDKRQTVVSRLEDFKYGKWTLQTLFEVASKLDVAVIVRFVDFSTFLRLTNDMSDEASRPEAYDPNTIESFSTVNLASPFGGPGALPINVPNWPNPSLGGGILGGQMMWGNPSELYWQQLLPRREQNTQSITKRPVEDLINSIRQQIRLLILNILVCTDEIRQSTSGHCFISSGRRRSLSCSVSAHAKHNCWSAKAFQFWGCTRCRNIGMGIPLVFQTGKIVKDNEEFGI